MNEKYLDTVKVHNYSMGSLNTIHTMQQNQLLLLLQGVYLSF